MERRHVAILPIVLAIGFILFKFLTAEVIVNPVTGSRHRGALDPQAEQALGLQAYREVQQKEGQTSSRAGRRSKRSSRSRGGWRAPRRNTATCSTTGRSASSASREVNAFCLPGGEIVVYTSILPVTGGPAGLATVLGHEMAHATSRHGSQRMLRQQLTQAAMMGAQGSISQLDPSQQQAVMAALGAGAQYGATLPFSRDQESEADHVGLIYMARAATTHTRRWHSGSAWTSRPDRARRRSSPATTRPTGSASSRSKAG